MAGKTLLALGILLNGSMAAGATNELTAQLQRPKRLQIVVQAQAVSNLYQADSRERAANGRLTFAPGYKLGENFRASASTSLIQDVTPQPKATLSNTRLALTHLPVSLSDDTVLIPAAGAMAPTNEEDRRLNSYNGGLFLEATTVTNWTIFGSPIATIAGLSLNKSQHTWDRNALGGANISYRTGTYFGVEKEIIRKLTILIDGEYSYAKTYQDSLRTQFDLGQSLTWQENKDWSFTIGHSNGGDALKANGTDYDVRVFDGHTSVIYANIRAIY